MMHIEMYTVSETAAILRIHRVTLYNEIRAGRIRPTRIGKRKRFTQQEIQRYLDAGQDEPKTRRQPVQRKQAAPRPDTAKSHDAIGAIGQAFKAKQRAARERR